MDVLTLAHRTGPARTLRGWRRAAAIACTAAAAMATAAHADPAVRPATPEYALKAAFLFQFTRFVEWPAEAFARPDAPFVIGIVGSDPFGAALDDMVAGETVRRRALVVRRFESGDDLGGCHILFISRSEAARIPALAKALRGRRTLTVADGGEFANGHGTIGFDIVDRRIRLRINLAAAEEAGLTISSKLLRQADVVKRRAGEPR